MRVEGRGFRVQSSGFRVQGAGYRFRAVVCFKKCRKPREVLAHLEYRLVQGPGFRVQGSGSRVQGSGLRVESSGSRVQGSGCRVMVRHRPSVVDIACRGV